MSGITSTTGLISGLPTADIIDQLILSQSVGLFRLQARVAALQADQGAFSTLLTRLSDIKSTIADFDDISLFDRFAANSSDTGVLTATAASGAVPSTYSFKVHSLVTNHQLISAGLPDSDSTPVGAGTISIEIGHGKLSPDTPLDALNGGAGVRGSIIRITDRSGQASEIDLTAALTVTDVLTAINNEVSIDVNARVSGDTIVIEDQTGDTAELLTVEDVGGGFAAVDLGLAQASSTGIITGADVLNLADTTQLTDLNDGNGIRTAKVGSDFSVVVNGSMTYDVSLDGRLDVDGKDQLALLNSGRGVRTGIMRITDRSGASADVDLTGAQTVADVLTAINGAGLAVSASVGGDGVTLQLSDTSGGDGSLIIEDIEGDSAADLGLAGTYDDDSIVGEAIYRLETLGDVMRAINYAFDQNGVNNAGGAAFKAEIAPDGNRLIITTPLPPGSSIEVIAADGSSAAEDLGILGSVTIGAEETLTGRSLLGGLNTVLLRSLNGGAGVTPGSIAFTNRNGDLPTIIDFAAAGVESLSDVIEAINATTSESGIQASINSAGNGLQITDVSGGSGVLQVTDVLGTMADELGIAGDADEGSINSGNLQLQYVSEATLLDDLNHGSGIRTGEFEISTASGEVFAINITHTQKTVRDVLDLIEANTAGTVTAAVNATGDGIVITDTTEGDGLLTVTDLDAGFAAADLRLAGSAAEGQTSIDGSYEVKIDVDSDDTLDDVVLKINNAGANVSAAVINDGSSTNPYLLSLSSEITGLKGEIVFDPGSTDLAMNTLVKAQDAVVFLGPGDGSAAVVIHSSTNTLTDVIPDVTINLTGTSDENVDLSVTQDIDSIVEDVRSFVDAYNAAMDYIDEVTFFDSETLEKGQLFGDGTVNLVRQRLYSAVAGEFENTPEITNRLSEVGISLVDDARLEFDETKFRETYADFPEEVESFFTMVDTGVGDALDEAMADLTDDPEGIVPGKTQLLTDQIELLNDRIDNQNELLDIKRAQLERQFANLESVLGGLQNQSQSLSVLSTLISAGVAKQ